MREVDERVRGACKPPQYHIWPPLCTVGRQHFSAEREVCKNELDRERECLDFCPWQAGFTPKEHQEMIQHSALMEWQRKCREDDQRWRERSEIQDRQWRKEEAERSERALAQSHRQYLTSLVVTGVLLTLVNVAAQLLAAYIQTKP